MVQLSSVGSIQMKGICNNNESDPKSRGWGMLQVENREEGRCGRRSLIWICSLRISIIVKLGIIGIVQSLFRMATVVINQAILQKSPPKKAEKAIKRSRTYTKIQQHLIYKYPGNIETSRKLWNPSRFWRYNTIWNGMAPNHRWEKICFHQTATLQGTSPPPPPPPNPLHRKKHGGGEIRNMSLWKRSNIASTQLLPSYCEHSTIESIQLSLLSTIADCRFYKYWPKAQSKVLVQSVAQYYHRYCKALPYITIGIVGRLALWD